MYKDIVIAIIDSEGNEINVTSSAEDTKHISAFKRLIAENGDPFNIISYLDKNGLNTTGFEISKFICSQGNIVFFHTDVNNNKRDIRRGSVMLPEHITYEQINKLNDLITQLEEEKFEVYFGRVIGRGKKKPSYEKIHCDLSVIKRIVKENANMPENTLKKNILVIVKNDGKVSVVPRLARETDHNALFRRASAQIPGLLSGFSGEFGRSGGFEFSSFLAAKGSVVFVPTNVNETKDMMVAVPSVLTNSQKKETLKLMKEFDFSQNIYVVSCRFKKKSSSIVITEQISASGRYEDACNNIIAFFGKQDEKQSSSVGMKRRG